MSKKVLKLAGKRPMLLALIVMATFTLGLLFSGWLTPSHLRASAATYSNPTPPPNNENTNCVATTNSWSGSCPSVVTNSSVSPSTIYDPWDTAPTMPASIVAPAYSTNNIFTQIITYSGGTNCDNVTNTENVTYSVSGVMWTNFSSPYTNFPSVLTNTFSAQAYVIVTSSDTNLCASPGVVYIGVDTSNSAMASASVQAADTGSSLVTWDPYGIIHKCVNTSPSQKPGVWRHDVGVGEKVNLSINGLPANTTVQWDCGGVGSIDYPSQPTCVWTAPDTTGIDPASPPQIPPVLLKTKSCTVKATFLINGDVKTPTVPFIIHIPESINMLPYYNSHNANSCSIGMKTSIFLGPASVNFSAVTITEEKFDAFTTMPIWLAGWGCYSGMNVHGEPGEVKMTTQVDATLGTVADSSADDDIYFPGGLGTGHAGGSIPNDWKCNSSGWNYQFYWSDQHADSAAISGQSGVYQLEVYKCGADFKCKSSDASINPQ